MLRKSKETIGSSLFYMILSFGLAFLVYHFELFPAGEHVWKYLNKAAVFIGAQKGTGILGTKGVLLLYAIYIGVIYFISAVVWFEIGKAENRKKMGFWLGLIWFFMPANFRVFFIEGELGAGLFLSVLPLLIYGLRQYLEEGKRKTVFAVAVLFLLMTVCSVDYGILTLFAAVNYLLVAGILQGRWKRAAVLAVSMFTAFLLNFVWIYQYWEGGVSVWSKENFFFCLGVSVLLMAVPGAVFSHKKSLVFFWTAVLLLLYSSSLLSPLIWILPGLQKVQAVQLYPLITCYTFLGFLHWDTLKKYLAQAVCILTVLDVLLVFGAGIIENGNFGMEETLDKIMEETLVARACEISQQKTAFFSGEREFSIAEYRMADQGSDILLTDDEEGFLKQALADSNFIYFFDRCLASENDTVIVEKERLSEKSREIPHVTEAAEKLGYQLMEETEGYLLYHQNAAEGKFTVESEYAGIAIGTGISEMVLMYPALLETSKTNLNEYSFEELSKYKLIYLNGFTYDDKEEAEQLILQLGEKGIRILIEAEGIPSDIVSKNREFLGVTGNDISFEKGFPIFYIQEEEVDCNLFAKGQENWQSLYLTGLDAVSGYFFENQEKIDFMGTAGNENIIFIGLNLGYHYALTGDPNAEKIYSEILGLEKEELPQRKLLW